MSRARLSGAANAARLAIASSALLPLPRRLTGHEKARFERALQDALLVALDLALCGMSHPDRLAAAAELRALGDRL